MILMNIKIILLYNIIIKYIKWINNLYFFLKSSSSFLYMYITINNNKIK